MRSFRAVSSRCQEVGDWSGGGAGWQGGPPRARRTWRGGAGCRALRGRFELPRVRPTGFRDRRLAGLGYLSFSCPEGEVLSHKAFRPHRAARPSCVLGGPPRALRLGQDHLGPIHGGSGAVGVRGAFHRRRSGHLGQARPLRRGGVRLGARRRGSCLGARPLRLRPRTAGRGTARSRARRGGPPTGGTETRGPPRPEGPARGGDRGSCPEEDGPPAGAGPRAAPHLGHPTDARGERDLHDRPLARAGPLRVPRSGGGALQRARPRALCAAEHAAWAEQRTEEGEAKDQAGDEALGIDCFIRSIPRTGNGSTPRRFADQSET